MIFFINISTRTLAIQSGILIRTNRIRISAWIDTWLVS